MKTSILRNFSLNLILIVTITSCNSTIAQNKEHSLLSIINEYELIQIKVLPSLEEFFLNNESFNLNYNSCTIILDIQITSKNQVYIKGLKNNCSSDKVLNDKILNDIRKRNFTVVKCTGKVTNHKVSFPIKFKEGKRIHYCCPEKVIQDWIGK